MSRPPGRSCPTWAPWPSRRAWDVPKDLTKAQASKLIDELQIRTERGSETNAG